MAVFPTKHYFFLVILFLICSFMISTSTTQARNLGVKITRQTANHEVANEKGEEMGASVEQLAAMDYTPARKKTPIHN
ncbi:hypothetical protein ABFS82_12G005000 [Erythranthe guttata]